MAGSYVILLLAISVQFVASDSPKNDLQQIDASDGDSLADLGGVVNGLVQTISKLQAELASQNDKMAAMTLRMTTLERTHKSQHVAFYADFGLRPFGAKSLTNNTPIVFNRQILNEGQAYHNDTGLFLAPVSGLYTFHLHVLADFQAAGHIELSMLKGSQVISVAAVEGGASDLQVHTDSCTAVVHMHRGERVTVQLTNISQGSLWGSSLTSFGGMLVHAD